MNKLIRYAKMLSWNTVHKFYLTKRSREYLAVRKDIKGTPTLTRKVIRNFAQTSTQHKLTDFVEAYINEPLKVIRLVDKEIPPNEPILICPLKNAIVYIKEHLEWHRKIGIKNFVYVVNMSTDGTFEWLMEQEDVSVLVAEKPFTGAKLYVWRKQAMDIFGYGRWYLYLDHDEFFYYPGIENVSIDRFIMHLESKGISSILTPMVDMYSQGPLYSADDNFREKYCFFDTDTYTFKKNAMISEIYGGPRLRILGFRTTCSKYVLIKACADTIPASHRIYPGRLRDINDSCLARAFLLHYKYLKHDYKRFGEELAQRIRNSQKAFTIYTDTFDKNPDLTFYYEGSQKLNSSMDLLKVNVGDRQFFEEFLSKNGISIDDGKG